MILKNKKILAIAIFPAPYRSELILDLSKKFEIDAFFERDNDYGRNKKWFETNNFGVLNKKQNIRKLKKCLKNLKTYDFVILYDFTSFLSMKIMIKCIIKRIPFAINCDGVIFGKKEKKIKKFIKSYFVKRASLLFATGDYAKQYFLNHKAHENKIIIHNFSAMREDKISYNSIPKNKNEIRNKYSLSNDSILFLGVGRFIDVKNYLWLIKHWNIFPKNYHLLLIGGGPLESEYLNFINCNRLDNVFIRDFMMPDEIFEIMSACDIFVHPTIYDAWGLVINECLSTGLPFVSSNTCVSALEFEKKNSKIGKTYKLNDFSDFKEKIDILLSKLPSKNDCFEVVNKYSIENMATTQANAIMDYLNKVSK